MESVFKRLRNKKGFALVAVYLVISVLVAFSATFVSQSVSQNNIANVFKYRSQALNAADAGLDHAIKWLRDQATAGNFPTGTTTNPWNGGAAQSLGGSSYNVVILRVNLSGAPNLFRYSITSTGAVGSMNRTLRKFVQATNFSNYIWFTNRETWGGRNVWFTRNDYLDGPVHTNAHFNIYGKDPGAVFAGAVSSVDGYIRFYNNRNNINLSQTSNPPYDIPDFQQGFTFGAQQVTMPGTALDLKTNAASGGYSFNKSTQVVLNSDGTMNYKVGHQSWQNNQPLPANGALFVNGNLTLSGTLDGQLTAGASGDVKITNNLVYASGDPVTNPACDDALGIISEGDVIIDRNAPTNLQIHGVMMALNSSFYLDNYTSGLKGVLSVRGGIIQKERGPVGTFSGSTGQKISGYTKDYLYDSRMLSSPPPFMPTTGDYITLAWKEV
ncbi:MAG: DUF4900 domain-containing protein [Candidatus Omnitrophica bacterium]|nr:DUF4900 domain-containing protein [Candidatus Omnitrophota bacterium]